MKTRILLIALVACIIFAFNAHSQVLNQNANWPNTNWNISGTYNVAGFSADPTLSANFSYDDDLAGNISLTDDINAESPVIDLTPAFNAGDIWIYVSVDYIYRKQVDNLEVQYWDADISSWQSWQAIPGNSSNTNYKTCINTTTFTTNLLDISAFTANQLSNFQYRFTYDDLGAWNWGFCLDSPTIFSDGPPTCIDPSNLTVSNILDTSAVLAWTENGTATMWDIQYDTSGFILGSGNIIIGVNSNPYQLNGISGNTTYDFYVRANCGPGDSSNWVGPFSFTTFCEPEIAPWVEDFENGGNIPDCWVQGPNNNEPWIFDTVAAHIGNFGVVNSTSASGGYFAYVDDSAPHSGNTLLISPRINASALVNPELTFYMISNNEGNTNVDFSIDVFDGTVWNNDFFTSNTNTLNGEWEMFTLDLSVLNINGNMQFRFTIDENNGGDFYDDVSIDDLDLHSGPTCFDPFALNASNTTDTSALLSWTVQDSASSWLVQYNVVGQTGSGTSVVANSNPFTLTGLQPNTSYEYYVQSICGIGDSSNIVGPFSFATNCTNEIAPWNEDFENNGIIPVCWSQDSLNNEPWIFDTIAGNVGAGGVINSNTTSDGYFAYVDDSGPNSNNTGLLSPMIDISALSFPELTFYVISNSGGAANVNFALDVWDGANWNNDFYTRNTNTVNGEWELITLYFTNLTITGDIQLRFRVSEQGGFFNFQDDIAIDDVDIHEAAGCPDPTNLTADSITTTSAQLSWTDIGLATSWLIQIDTSGFVLTGSTTAATSNPYTITGLMAGTTYDYYVQSICGSDSSNWIGPFTFTTNCLPLTAPWVEDFDSNIGAIPDCWRQGANNNEDWIFDTNGGHVGNVGVWTGLSHSGGQFAYVDDSGPHSIGTTLLSPMIDVSGLTMPELSFYAISNNEGNTNVDFSLDIWDGSAWNIGYYTRNSNTLNGDWELLVVSLNALTITGDLQLRFIVDENNGADIFDDIAIDDVDIREGPPCPQPSDVTAINTTSNAIDITWTENGSAAMWNVIWGPPGFTISGSGVSVNATNYSIAGLSSSTSYDIYVRSDCNPDTSVWVGPITVTTLADFCAGDIFYDSGGPTGTYSSNEDITTTICPSAPGDAVTVVFTDFETQFNADALYVFNGPDTSSMLFDSGNPATFGGFPAGGYYGNDEPGPFTSTDASGCLTFRFLSNGFNNQDGWEAEIICGPPPCSTPLVNLPEDTSFCLNQSITLDAGSGPFIYSWSTGATTQTITLDSAALGGIGDYDIDVYVIDTTQNCSTRDTIEVEIESCVGISEIGNQIDISIYPNPNSGMMILTISHDDLKNVYFSITDITGHEIMKSIIFNNSNMVKEQIDLSNHAKGMYFLNVFHDEGIMTKKLIIQ